MCRVFIFKSPSTAPATGYQPHAHPWHIAGNQSWTVSAIFRISTASDTTATARCQIKYRATHLSGNMSGSGPIKPHYFWGYHLLPNGVEIAAYLLVNNKKDTTDKKKKPFYWDGERERDGREKADREPRDFQGQFHSVERASRRRPPAVMQQPSWNESQPLSSPGLNSCLNKKHNQTPNLKV